MKKKISKLKAHIKTLYSLLYIHHILSKDNFEYFSKELEKDIPEELKEQVK